MPQINSIDYTNLIQYLTYKQYGHHLNSYQTNIALFLAYGIYYSLTNNLLFNDDEPKIWASGPIFPISYKQTRFKSLTNTLDNFILDKINTHENIMKILLQIINTIHNAKAVDLLKWACKYDSPWYQALYVKNCDGIIYKQNKWNTPIPLKYIKSYFQANILPKYANLV